MVPGTNGSSTKHDKPEYSCCTTPIIHHQQQMSQPLFFSGIGRQKMLTKQSVTESLELKLPVHEYTPIRLSGHALPNIFIYNVGCNSEISSVRYKNIPPVSFRRQIWIIKSTLMDEIRFVTRTINIHDKCRIHLIQLACNYLSSTTLHWVAPHLHLKS